MLVATISVVILALLIFGVIEWLEDISKVEKIFCAKISLLIVFSISLAVFLGYLYLTKA